MKKLAFAVLLLFVLMASAVIAGDQDFTLVNNSGRTFTRVYLSPSHESSWSESDRFTGDGIPIRPGRSCRMNFSSRYEGVRYWDLRVYFSNGNYWTWSKLDLLTIYRVSVDRRGTAHFN